MTRAFNELRPVKITRGFTRAAPGSVLYEAGQTTVLCTADVQADVPAWLLGQEKGWITAEYSMLPGSTSPRKPRDRGGRVDGRATEIQRLVGRSLRAIADLCALGERLITVDCDVLQADGGTRTASITAGFIALVDAVRSVQGELPDPERFPLRDSVAAISVGMARAGLQLDLDYQQDAAAEVDMNLVMTGRGRFVEIQGAGEEATFGEDDLEALVQLGIRGIGQLTNLQKEALAGDWPF
jgi:ribonuclease PH